MELWPPHPHHDYLRRVPCDLRLGDYLLSVDTLDTLDNGACGSLIIDFLDDDSQGRFRCPNESTTRHFLINWFSELAELPPESVTPLAKEVACFVLHHTSKQRCPSDRPGLVSVPHISVRRVLHHRVKRATDESIDALETVRAEELADCDDQRNGSCVICLEDLVLIGGNSSTIIGRLPCTHVFHKHCLVEWLKNSYMCPLCRFEMPVTNV